MFIKTLYIQFLYAFLYFYVQHCHYMIISSVCWVERFTFVMLVMLRITDPNNKLEITRGLFYVCIFRWIDRDFHTSCGFSLYSASFHVHSFLSSNQTIFGICETLIYDKKELILMLLLHISQIFMLRSIFTCFVYNKSLSHGLFSPLFCLLFG